MKHLTAEQRYAISLLLQQGKTQKEIIKIIGKYPSTVSREIARNCDKRSREYNGLRTGAVAVFETQNCL